MNYEEWLQMPETVEFRTSLERKLNELKEIAVFSAAATIEQCGIMKIEQTAEARVLNEIINTLKGADDDEREGEAG